MGACSVFLINSSKKQFTNISIYNQENTSKKLLEMEKYYFWNLGKDEIWVQQKDFKNEIYYEFILQNYYFIN